MTTETIAYLLGYGAFFMIACLLVFAWRRESRLFATTKEKLIRAYDAHEGTFERMNQALIDKRRLSWEKSLLEVKDKEQNKLIESLARINANLTDDNNRMSDELDRGNEMIAWLKADLDKAYDLNAQNEISIMELLANGKFPDEKGIYRKNYISKNGESLPLGKYIDSLYASTITKMNFYNLPNSHDLARIRGGEYVSSPSAFIDWTVPQVFPKDYLIPIDTNVIAIDSPKMVGKTTEKSSVPFCKWSYGATSIALGFKLAPLNPTDHPLHPEFKNKAQ
jgi:hypothetical protein